MDNAQKEQFISLTHFLGQVLGPNHEVVFHAIEDEGSSIVAIANSHISGRTLNSPLTAFASKLIQEKAYLDKDFLCDYKASVGKSKIINGSTFFIKDDNKLKGILCINHDTTELRQAVSKIIELEKLEDFYSAFEVGNYDEPSADKITDVETLSHSIEDILNEDIDLNYLDSGFALTTASKQEMILKLYKKGIFNIKGSIPIAAKFLNMSEPSVYRYLQKLKK
ncbi:MAG: transcriptional regulator [Campylobacteraceae bacterium]